MNNFDDDMVAQEINQALQSLEPDFLEIINESHMHHGPATDSHYKVTIVSTAFDELRQVARHQKIYGLLKAQLDGPVHALALHTLSPDEWQKNNQIPDSPNCRGGSLIDKKNNFQK